MQQYTKIGLSSLFIIFFVGSLIASEIIPSPLKTELLEGRYALPSSPAYSFSIKCKNEAALMAGYLKDRFGIDARNSKGPGADIQLIITETKKADAVAEGYQLKITGEGIRITAPSSAGIFYGIQSLLQLLSDQNGSLIRSLQCQQITDKPRFVWRSFMLDEARNFKGTPVVKKLLDQMAALKMNTFHWHLTDDQGWRIEIKKYPLLTTIGSVRKVTQTGGIGSKTFDSTVHKGYYTKQEIKEIVQYAAARHIKVVPEIEMPGHASAAIAAYPWLGVTGKKIEVAVTYGVFKDIFNVADPRVVGFFHDVLNEVAAMFPSNIIHIGGDEVIFDQWKSSPCVQQFIEKNKVKSPADLQLWFTNSISSYLGKKQLRMMGWNDITGHQIHETTGIRDTKPDRKLSPNTIVHFWKGDPALVNETVLNGYDVVNSYHEFTYLDYNYTSISLQKAYSFEPVPETLDPKLHHKVLGLGCQMWGEWITTHEKMYEQIFPRIAAYAEVGWTDKRNKNYNRFKAALPALESTWKKNGISGKNINF
ncbi:beta-N-acetylhexosaminidase [Flavitalea sp.]|nr:beta-N-acetylhexosaminidase [Flavitalea sp.]